MAAWRFFSGASGWKWQQLTARREVLAESKGTHATYDECVRDAISRGYAFVASQDHLTRSPALHARQDLRDSKLEDVETQDEGESE